MNKEIRSEFWDTDQNKSIDYAQNSPNDQADQGEFRTNSYFDETVQTKINQITNYNIEEGKANLANKSQADSEYKQDMMQHLNQSVTSNDIYGGIRIDLTNQRSNALPLQEYNGSPKNTGTANVIREERFENPMDDAHIQIDQDDLAKQRSQLGTAELSQLTQIAVIPLNVRELKRKEKITVNAIGAESLAKAESQSNDEANYQFGGGEISSPQIRIAPDYDAQDQDTNFDQYSELKHTRLQNLERSGFEHSPTSRAQEGNYESHMGQNDRGVTPSESFISKIPTIKRRNIAVLPPSIRNSSQEDLQTFHNQNLKLKDMVILVVDKLDAFIIKTLQIRQQKKMIAQTGKQPDNEIFVQKQQEHDSYLKYIKEAKKKIKNMKLDLEDDENFKKMIDMENEAKEQHLKLKQLQDENTQLKRIHGCQAQSLDSSIQQKLKKEEIRAIKEHLQSFTVTTRKLERKKRDRAKKIQDKHQQLVDYQERIRGMNEIMRQRKIEEKNEIDKMIDYTKQQQSLSNEVSEQDAGLSLKGGNSVKAGSVLSRKRIETPEMGQRPQLSKDQIVQLEKQCQRMIFEKEDKYLENEQKLKDEDQQLIDVEQEIRRMEMKLKEKNQENNLFDFKLRNMARNNQHDIGFLKPNSGIHSGMLSNNAATPLGSAIGLANDHHNRGVSHHIVSKSLDVQSMRQGSKQSHRPMSRYSIASSRLEQDTILTSKKRRPAQDPSLNRIDTKQINIMLGNLKTPKIKPHPKSVVHSNKMPSQQRGGQLFIRNPIQGSMRKSHRRNQKSNVIRSLAAPIKGRNGQLLGIKTSNSPRKNMALNKKIQYATINTEPTSTIQSTSIGVHSPVEAAAHQGENTQAIEMRRQQAEKAIQQTANNSISVSVDSQIQESAARYKQATQQLNSSYDTEVAKMTKQMKTINQGLSDKLMEPKGQYDII